MLGDVHEPFLVEPVRGEITLHQIINYWRPGPLVTALALRNHRLDTSYLAQPPNAPLADVVAKIVEVIGEDPVPTVGVILM